MPELETYELHLPYFQEINHLNKFNSWEAFQHNRIGYISEPFCRIYKLNPYLEAKLLIFTNSFVVKKNHNIHYFPYFLQAKPACLTRILQKFKLRKSTIIYAWSSWRSSR